MEVFCTHPPTCRSSFLQLNLGGFGKTEDFHALSIELLEAFTSFLMPLSFTVSVQTSKKISILKRVYDV